MSQPARRADDQPRHAVPGELLHDLRTPLGQIIGYTELLMERAGGEGDAAGSADLKKVSAAGYRMLQLLEERFVSSRPAEERAPGPGLADFIVGNREAILAEWETFARTRTPAAGGMDGPALRDHASEMLTVIAADLRTPQGGDAQAEKPEGKAPVEAAGVTPAEEHGADRAGSGFTIEQTVSEYRALRASVIRLWTEARGEATPADRDHLTRLDEAIDQALAESVKRYSEELDTSREMLLALLGHDLRTPLGVVYASARLMLDTGELAEPHLTLTERIAGSSARMVRTVGDLLDFTRSCLGGRIAIVREDMSMGRVVHDVVDELSALHPERTIHIEARGEERGSWDCARMSQALVTLVGSALEHGSARSPVGVSLGGDDHEITIAVHHEGPAIPRDQLNGIFNPIEPRDGMGGDRGPAASPGLGLYVAERIVHAHRGAIEVDSSEQDGTTFTVHLPRHD